MAYPQETKDQAAALYAEGLSLAEIGRRLGVSQSTTVYRWVSPKGQAYCADPEFKERQKGYGRAYRADPENKKRSREHQRAYEADPENKEHKNERRKDRYATDPAFRTRQLLSARTRLALKGDIIKSASTEELLGIPVLELAQQWDIEYDPNWRSQGLHIDHIRPCASFDLADPDQQRLCFNHRNLQLLPAVENLLKGDSWTPEMELAWTTRMLDLSWTGELFLTYAAAKLC